MPYPARAVLLLAAAVLNLDIPPLPRILRDKATVTMVGRCLAYTAGTPQPNRPLSTVDSRRRRLRTVAGRF